MILDIFQIIALCKNLEILQQREHLPTKEGGMGMGRRHSTLCNHRGDGYKEEKQFNQNRRRDIQ